MKHIFIINPFAGKKDAEKLIPIIKAYFNDESAYQIIMTEHVKHATQIASGFKKEDDVCLYAIGGDGTAFEVLNGLNEGVCMAVIPNGTGNDYFKMINYNNESIERTLIETIEGKQVQVDYACANNVRYLNASSMGLDANVNELANAIGKNYPIPKSLVYVVAALIVVLKPKPIDFVMELNGQTIRKKALLIAVMNGKYYGGGFLPTPMSEIQDGLLDICVVDDMKIGRIFSLLPKYFKGQHLGCPEVTFYQAESVSLKTTEKVLYGCDGETNSEDHIEYRIRKNSLTLRVPKGSTLK